MRGAATLADAVALLRNKLSPSRLEKQQMVLAKRTRGVCVVLENVQDPHNATACFRTMDSMGVQTAHVITKYSNNVFVNRDSISTGSHKWLTIHYHHDVSSCVAHLKRDQFKILASDLDPREVKTLPSRRDTVGHGDDTKYALVFGNEERGISKAMRQVADETFQLPMFGFAQSYNLSVSVAISLYHMLEHGFLSNEQHRLTPEEKDALHFQWLARDVSGSREILKRGGIIVDDL